ncbi:MAG: EI24 domain-containing protein [Micromonosporaceae bacterium]|nr:EI24 domain-containing protein [Micromonosporaceae bacterium]
MEKRIDGATRPARGFVAGIGLFLRGLAIYGRNPGLVLLGVLPALITFVLLGGAFAVLVYFIDDVARAVTWFAGGWSTGLRNAIRVLAGIAILGAAGLIAVVGFTGLTVAIGDPFYERIAERVDGQLGDPPRIVETRWWRGLLRGVGDSIRLVLLSTTIGILLFLAGFLPVVGQTVVPVLGALFGGWALAIELTGVAMARRGFRLRERRRMLRRNRALALGFGVTVFVGFLIPLGAVLLMPAAVSGGTLLTRRVRGEPT